MVRWKASLGLNAGNPIGKAGDPKCLIKSLALRVEGREDVKIELSSPKAVEELKNKPFTIKEGAKFHIQVVFQVNHDVLSGLKYLQVVKRKGIRVSKDEEMLGSFAPNTDQKPVYTKDCKYTSYLTRPSQRNSRRCVWIQVETDLMLIHVCQQSLRRRLLPACLPVVATMLCPDSWMTMTTPTSCSSGPSRSPRTGNRIGISLDC